MHEDAKMLAQVEQIKNAKHINEMIKLFGINDENGVVVRMNQIFQQLNDINKFIRISKQLLELDEDMREEVVLSYIIKLCEKMKMQKYNDPDLVLKLMRILKVEDPSLLISKVRSFIKTSKFSNSGKITADVL